MFMVIKFRKFVFVGMLLSATLLIWLVSSGRASNENAAPKGYLLSPSSLNQVESEQQAPAAPNTVLVGFKTEDGALASANHRILNKAASAIPVVSIEPLIPNPLPYAFSTSNEIELENAIYRLHLENGANISSVIQTLNNDPSIAFAEPDYLAHIIATPNDSLYSQQWGLGKIQAPSAWDIITGSSEVVIAVIDSGIDTNHPDLVNQFWANPGEIPGNNLDDDNNGYIDDIHGWNIVDNNADLSDNTGHGTEVAGIIAATSNNGTGIAGLCWQCRIMVIKVTQPGGVANYSDIAAGIHYATQKGADVINLSLGANSDSTTLKSALAQAAETAVIIGGAGNNSNDAPFYPAAYDDYVLAVAGTTSSDTKVATSNYGSWVDVTAPGESITTTFDGSSYGTSSGTSLAAPFASGLAGLLYSHHPDWSPNMVRAQIIQAADDISSLNPGFENLLGSGRLNAQLSLIKATQPILLYKSQTIDGQENGRPEPGSTVDIDISLTNEWASAKNVRATLSSSNALVTVVTGSANYGTINTYEVGTNLSPFRITISGAASYAQTLALNLTIIADGGYATTVPVTITTASGIELVESNIVGNTIWSSDKIYILKRDVGIAPGATLTIEPGTEIRFDGFYKLQVSGTLIAAGTEEKPILFTTNLTGSTDNNPTINEWNSISFTDSSEDAIVDVNGNYVSGSTVQYAIIEYANRAIDINLASPYISNNKIWRGASGIYGEFGSPIIVNNSIQFNREFGVYLRGNGSPRIISNRIINNSRGVFLGYFMIGNVRIEKNLIANNDGVGLNRAIFHEDTQIVYNSIIDNDGTGIQSGSGSSTVTIANNNILRNAPYNASLFYDSVDGERDIVAAQNYWGTTNTALINQLIYDFQDDINVGIVNYTPILTSPEPDAPAFLTNLTMTPLSPIGIETLTFNLYFSRPMDESINPVVTFGKTSPYSTYQVSDNAQWLNSSHWLATFEVTSLVPRENYKLSVSGAHDSDGMEIAEDTRYGFTVDYAGEITDQTPPSPPIVMAGGLNDDTSAVMAIWGASDPDSLIVGYRYAIGSAPGATDIVNWTTVNNTTLVHQGLGLVEGRQYWLSVQARNVGGLWSASGYSDFVAGQPFHQQFLPVILKQ